MFKYSIWKLAIVSRSFRLQRMLGLMIHALWVRSGKSDSGQFLRCSELLRACDFKIDGRGCDKHLETPGRTLSTWMTYMLSWLRIKAARQTHEVPSSRLNFCFIRFLALSNCWSVVTEKTSDRSGSLSVCTVLPAAAADKDTQREAQVRASHFARLSITGFLIRRVEQSAAGGRLYGHRNPTSPYSLALHSLAPQHMAVLPLLPIWGVIQMTAPCWATSLWESPVSLCLRWR